MTTVFSRIIAGELPGTFVWRDDRCVAFMSINPIATGHVLVVPVEEIDHWLDAPADLVVHLFEITRIIGLAQRDAFDCRRIGVIIAGYEVPHFHVHVIPTNSMADVAFANAAESVDSADLEAAAGAIRTRLRAMGRTEV
jgi:histidine triad (HIT) family protein